MMNYSYYNGICSDMEHGMFTNRGFDPEVRTDLVLYHENCADGSCSAGLHAAMKKAATRTIATFKFFILFNSDSIRYKIYILVTKAG